ncbi:MAG: hypothetical protein QM791_13810 [Ferruginibacter sp.]
MKKILLCAAVLVASAATVSAQNSKTVKQPIFSAGAEIALPVGDFKEGYKFGLGATVQGEYPAAENLGITLNAGYLSFTGKTFEFMGDKYKNEAQGVIPVLAGAKYYFNDKVYGHAQLGLSFFNLGVGSAFTYAPGIGVKASDNIDVLVKYQAASKNGSTASFIGARVAYRF